MLIDREDATAQELVRRYPGLKTCKQTILSGGNEKDHYENCVSNLRHQVLFVGRDDPWMQPGMLPPQRVLYDLHPRIIQAEREMFESTMDIGGPDALLCHHADSPSTYVNYRVQYMWATWLAARVGFTRIF